MSRTAQKDIQSRLSPDSGILVVRQAAQLPDAGLSLVPSSPSAGSGLDGAAMLYVGTTEIGPVAWSASAKATFYTTDAPATLYRSLEAACWATAANARDIAEI